MSSNVTAVSNISYKTSKEDALVNQNAKVGKPMTDVRNAPYPGYEDQFTTKRYIAKRNSWGSDFLKAYVNHYLSIPGQTEIREMNYGNEEINSKELTKNTLRKDIQTMPSFPRKKQTLTSRSITWEVQSKIPSRRKGLLTRQEILKKSGYYSNTSTAGDADINFPFMATVSSEHDLPPGRRFTSKVKHCIGSGRYARVKPAMSSKKKQIRGRRLPTSSISKKEFRRRNKTYRDPIYRDLRPTSLPEPEDDQDGGEGLYDAYDIEPYDLDPEQDEAKGRENSCLKLVSSTGRQVASAILIAAMGWLRITQWLYGW